MMARNIQKQQLRSEKFEKFRNQVGKYELIEVDQVGQEQGISVGSARAAELE
jgi:hypothetical protein